MLAPVSRSLLIGDWVEEHVSILVLSGLSPDQQDSLPPGLDPPSARLPLYTSENAVFDRLLHEREVVSGVRVEREVTLRLDISRGLCAAGTPYR